MKLSRGLLLTSFLLIFVTGALAQDSLLGKNKGSGGSGSSSGNKGGSGGSNSGSPSRQSSGSHKDRNSNGGSSNNDDSSYDSRPQRSRDDNTRQGDGILRKYSSKSGRVNYGTIHNEWKNDTHPAPVSIDRAPTQQAIEKQRTSMKDQIRREDRGQVHDRDRDRDRDHDHDRDWDRDNWNSGWRVGYYHYNRNFRDDYFCYPYYAFDPFNYNCVASPFYYYSFLPGYLDTDRCVISSLDYSMGFFGDPFDYYPTRYRYNDDDPYNRNRYNGYRRPLDIAIDDLVDAFENQDRRALDRLVPARGTIALGVDNAPTYGVRADDFYDMMVDVVMNSRTINYDIEKVTTQDEEAEVIARHDFLDSWGRRQCVYHKYHLFREHGQIVIRYFETNQYMVY